MSENLVNIIIEIEPGKTFNIECPKSITFLNFKKLLASTISDIQKISYYVIFKNKKYNKNNYRDIIKFENGDKVSIINDKKAEAYHAKFHLDPKLNEGKMTTEKKEPDPNLNEGKMTTEKLTGILNLILIKYISNCITNINLISSKEIREIILELREGIKLEQNPEEDIKSNLTNKDGGNILFYSIYVNSIINDEVLKKLLELVDPDMKKHIIKYWSILSSYEIFNAKFGDELFNAIKNSYFDYSLVNLSIYEQSNKDNYLSSMKECNNIEKKILYHGTQVDPIAKIITKGFLYTRKPFYGMGIYFTDMLDYVAFYCGGNDYESRRNNFGKVIPVNSTFSCVGAEIYYNKNMLKKIYDFSYYIDELNYFPTYEQIKTEYKHLMIPKYGVHFVQVEPYKGRVRNKAEIINDKKERKFIGREYAITEKEQMLPLYGLTLKRNEYFILWRDPNFQGKNTFSNFLNIQKLYAFKATKMNIYFENKTENALELISKKKYNKIILISSVGKDLSGKTFIEAARGILGFDVVVLFFSQNREHLKWIQDFPNALYTDNMGFFQEYILNYNQQGLYELKNKMEKSYGIKLNLTGNYLEFPKFINEKGYKDIIFDDKSPFFKKVIIKNTENNLVFYLNKDRVGAFCTVNQLDKSNINYYKWYITMIRNEITFFSQENYLDANLEKKTAVGFQYMKRFKFEKINEDEFIFYYETKNNLLTIKGNLAVLQNENSNYKNQKFELFDITE